MLAELRQHIPRLGTAVAQARAGGNPSFDWETTGAAETVRRKATTARRPRLSKAQPPTSEYESLTASEVVGKLTEFTQEQLTTDDRLRARAPEAHDGDRARTEPAGGRAVRRLRRPHGA